MDRETIGMDIRKLQRGIDAQLGPLMQELRNRYEFGSLSRFAFREFSEFGMRRGNRVRSVLLLLSYLGYSRKPLAPGLLRWAMSLELIQNFILIHDDLIDCASLRRGGPALHLQANARLSLNPGSAIGRNMALVLGDMFFAAGIDIFMELREEPGRKQRALAELMRAAVATGCGEINELLLDLADIAAAGKPEIFKTYDLKTALYTFSTPLRVGAMMGGASSGELNLLARIGLLCGRAFQIRDDITELLSKKPQAQKTFLADFKASKKTILLWYFLRQAGPADRRRCEDIYRQKTKTQRELTILRDMFIATGAVEQAEREIRRLVRSAGLQVEKLSAAPACRAGIRQLVDMIAACSTPG